MTDTDERTARRALDGVSDAYAAIDGSWRIEWANATAAAMLDRSREELIGASVDDALPDGVAAALRETFGDVAGERRSSGPGSTSPGESESRLRVECDSTGGSFDVRAIPDGDGLCVYVRDVTEPRRMDRELARNATIVEAVHDAVVAFDGEGTVASVNQAAEGLLGADRQELVGSPVAELADATTLDAESADAFADAAAVVRDGVAGERRFRVSCDGGDGRRIGEVQLVPLPVDDADGTVGVIREVTEREEYDRIVTALHDVTRRLFGADGPDEICAITVEAAADLLDLELSGIWLLDEERNRLDPVAATARTHDEIGGLPHFAENEGLIWDAFRSGDSEKYDDLREVAGVYNPDTPVRSELIVPIGAHGVLMAGEFSPDRFDDTDVELAGILAANVEAALERTDRERLLRRRTEELERQRDRMETVAAVLSREIERRLAAARDALAASIGSATTRDERSVDAGQSGSGGVTGGDAADAVDELATAERLVADVREVAGAGGAETSRTRVSLADAAGAAAERVDGVAVRPLDDPGLRVDRDRFERLLAAFFRFAVARADGDAVVHVGRIDGRDGFYVADDGPPIPDGERDRVFDPEYAASLDVPGLGPSLADEIASANGWELSLSAPSEGGDGERADGDAPENDRRGARFEITGVTTLSR